MRILLFKIGALGDVLMTTPLLRQLRKKYPKAQIDYLIGNSTSIVLKNNQHINNVLTFDEKIFFDKKLFKLFQLIRKIKKEKYDLIFVLDKHWIFTFVSWLMKIPQRIGFFRDKLSKLFLTKGVEYGKIEHEINYYLSLMNSKTKNKKMDLVVHLKDSEKAKKILFEYRLNSFYIFINSGGDNKGEKGGVRKLPDHKFKQILLELSKKHKVLLLGGKNDENYYYHIAFSILFSI